jgi:putative nucleotidyltransferase with HDIG domain
MRFDVADARACAVRLLAGGQGRLDHAKAAVRRAEEIASVVGPQDRELLLCATWLHDVGYAAQLRQTGFHPLDGALYLAAAGWPERLCSLVAHHCEARVTAAALGLTTELNRFRREEGAVTDALVHADMAAGPSGERMSLRERLDDIERRHLEDPLTLRRARVARRPALVQAVQRTEQRLTGLRCRVPG